MRYTVIYTSYNQWGTLVHHASIFVKIGDSILSVCKERNIDPTSIVLVFHGHHSPVDSNWDNVND